MKNLHIFIALLSTSCFTYTQSINCIHLTSEDQIEYIGINEFTDIFLSYSHQEKVKITTQGLYGHPKVPVVQKKYLVPMNAYNFNVSITSSSSTNLGNQHKLIPEQPPIPLDGSEPPELVDV